MDRPGGRGRLLPFLGLILLFMCTWLSASYAAKEAHRTQRVKPAVGATSATKSNGNAAMLAELSGLLNENGTFHAAVDPNSDEVVEMMKLVEQRSIPNAKAIAVSLVSQGMLDFTYNWLCSVRRFGFTNYVILAGDANTYSSLKSANEPVVFMAGREFGSNRFLRYGTTAYQGFMHIRLLYIKHLLELGYKVLLFDVDQIWSANPFDFIDVSSTIDYQTQQEGVGAAPSACMGFIFLNPTPALMQVWEEVRQEHAYRTTTLVYGEHNTEQRIFNKRAGRKPLSNRFLNYELFINGGLYWHQATNINSFLPVQIHVNYVIGHRNKLARAKGKKLWMLPKTKDSSAPIVCDYSRAVALTHAPVPPPRLQDMVITIKILPSSYVPSLGPEKRTTEESLGALIDSILAADYEVSANDATRWHREKRIDVELHQQPAIDAAPVDKLYERTLKALQARWTLGEVRLVRTRSVTGASVHPSSLERRLAAWEANSDQEAAIMIDDQQMVSREWWRWVRYALGAHFCDLGSFEARLYGVVLERNTDIIALQANRTDLLKHSVRLPYYFQNVGYRATLFLPRLWRRFAVWVRDWKKMHDTDTYPVLAAFDYPRMHELADLPTSPEEDLRNRWYAWWLAYTAEIGIVALHPPASLSVVKSQYPPRIPPRNQTPFNASLLLPHVALLPGNDTLAGFGTLDLRGVRWHSPMHLDGILNPKTTLFVPHQDNPFTLSP